MLKIDRHRPSCRIGGTYWGCSSRASGGIGDVKILNNEDGTEFLSIEFCGPIRAAGGTTQALGVLIGDMVRRELGLNRYILVRS